MPNASENVHGIRVESIHVFSVRSETTRFSEFPLLLQEDQIHSIISICVLHTRWTEIKLPSVSAEFQGPLGTPHTLPNLAFTLPRRYNYPHFTVKN